MMRETDIHATFAAASEIYQQFGVDAEAAIARLAPIPISIHCWQGDDLAGFEPGAGALGGGLMATGNHFGKARNVDEFRADFEKMLSLLPGKHRINLHAIYGEFGGKKIDRDAIGFAQFSGWADWVRGLGIGVDFNPTCFSHPKAADGFTLSHADAGIRRFWIDHCIACRKIAANIGKRVGNPSICNLWIPDGTKDTPADRNAPRMRLRDSLDEIFETPLDPRHMRDSVEGKLFGLGSESYVVGSHEFYYGYALRRGKMLCMDAGHYHPTESLADKISAVLMNLDEILLHVSRGVRWDSDHVIVFDDVLRDIAREIVAGGFLSRVHIGLDYFDASINRVAAWTIGVRNMQKALLAALLEPTDRLRQAEDAGDLTARLALQEEFRLLPLGAVWNEFCVRQNVPPGAQGLDAASQYEADVLSKRR